MESYLDDGGIRLHLKLELPDGPAGKCPLVIVLHGFTGHMEEPHIISICRTIRSCGYASLRAELYGHGKSGGSLGFFGSESA